MDIRLFPHIPVGGTDDVCIPSSDLVILDLGLPDRDGMTFLREVRQSSFTPIIVLSARSDERDKVEALNEAQMIM